MGSFFGHIDEGIMFIVLAIWWMYNMFRDYHKSVQTGEPYRSRISYPSNICNRQLPLEIIAKTLFPFIGFSLEIWRDYDEFGSLKFLDKDNHFRSLVNLQHMTIYGLFTIHGVLDFLVYFKVSLIVKEFNYMALAISFFWYGTEFYYHSGDTINKSPMENMIHRLPVTTIFMMMMTTIWEMRQRELILPQLLRCLGILMLGTWFTHGSFILFLPYPFPGTNSNPNWDQYEETNVHFVSALYGFHLMFNLVLMLLFYALIVSYRKLVGVVKRFVSCDRSMAAYGYHKLNGVLVETADNVKLLDKMVDEYHD